MKLVRYSRDGGDPALGLAVDERIHAIADLIPSAPKDEIALITGWAVLRKDLSTRLKAVRNGGLPLSQVRLHAPVGRPGKIMAIGLNYADHIAESRMETPKVQVWFAKMPTAVNDPFADIMIPRVSQYVDYEAELVAVIGQRCKHVTAQNAPSVIFGYMAGNDVTERFWQHQTAQWTLGKSFDTHAPIGPWIVTSDEVPDPHALAISCSVNGEIRQSSNTRHLVFNLYQQIEHLSAAMTLEPGDLIFTGTPGGIGAAMDPKRFLKAGDMVRVEIAGIGAIEARMREE